MFSVKKTNSVEPEQLFKTLSDPTRLRLLNLLAEAQVCVCDLHGTLGLDQPKVSRHLAQFAPGWSGRGRARREMDALPARAVTAIRWSVTSSKDCAPGCASIRG